MRKTFMTLLALGIVSALTAGPASASHTAATHADSQAYESGSPGAGDLIGFCLEEADPEPQPDLPLDSCVHSTPVAGDGFVDITITDDNNNPIFATVGQDLDDDGAIDTAIAEFCGSISDHQIVDVHPLTGLPVDVIVFAWDGPGTIGGVCSPTSTPAWGGPATSGTMAFQYYAK